MAKIVADRPGCEKSVLSYSMISKFGHTTIPIFMGRDVNRKYQKSFRVRDIDLEDVRNNQKTYNRSKSRSPERPEPLKSSSFYTDTTVIEDEGFDVLIEHCVHCEQHQQTTHHNPRHYSDKFIEIFDAVKQRFPNANCKFKELQGVRKTLGPRLGSFEVEVLFKGDSKPTLIYSKIRQYKFPSGGNIVATIQRLLEETAGERQKLAQKTQKVRNQTLKKSRPMTAPSRRSGSGASMDLLKMAETSGVDSVRSVHDGAMGTGEVEEVMPQERDIRVNPSDIVSVAMSWPEEVRSEYQPLEICLRAHTHDAVGNLRETIDFHYTQSSANPKSISVRGDCLPVRIVRRLQEEMLSEVTGRGVGGEEPPQYQWKESMEINLDQVDDGASVVCLSVVIPSAIDGRIRRNMRDQKMRPRCAMLVPSSNRTSMLQYEKIYEFVSNQAGRSDWNGALFAVLYRYRGGWMVREICKDMDVHSWAEYIDCVKKTLADERVQDTPVIEIEHCNNCHLHQDITKHDEVKYVECFAGIASLAAQEYPTVQVLRSNVSRPRLGSFEVNFRSGVAKVPLFSKLTDRGFPHPRHVLNRVTQLFIGDIPYASCAALWVSVSHIRTGEPLSGVLVTGGRCEAFTDERGICHLILPKGRPTHLKYSAHGFVTITETIDKVHTTPVVNGRYQNIVQVLMYPTSSKPSDFEPPKNPYDMPTDADDLLAKLRMSREENNNQSDELSQGHGPDEDGGHLDTHQSDKQTQRSSLARPSSARPSTRVVTYGDI